MQEMCAAGMHAAWICIEVEFAQYYHNTGSYVYWVGLCSETFTMSRYKKNHIYTVLLGSIINSTTTKYTVLSPSTSVLTSAFNTQNINNKMSRLNVDIILL